MNKIVLKTGDLELKRKTTVTRKEVRAVLKNKPKKMQTVLRQRMYSFVIYQLSGIQAGIQTGHATNEYQLKFGAFKEYKQWVKKDKTVILLNGGTTNQSNALSTETGTIQKYLQFLKFLKVKATPFYEPDLNNAMTAISFLVDERIWDRENYPDPKFRLDFVTPDEKTKALKKMYGKEVAELREFLSEFKLASN